MSKHRLRLERLRRRLFVSEGRPTSIAIVSLDGTEVSGVLPIGFAGEPPADVTWYDPPLVRE